MSGIQGGVAHCAQPPECLESKVETEQHKDEKREDLEGESGHHDVIAIVGTFVLVARRAGHASADRLKEERGNIAGNEDPGV